MRVLIYSSIFPSSRAPVRGIYNLYIAERLSRLVQVQVVCPIPWKERVKAPNEILRLVSTCKNGMRVYYPTFFPVSRIAPKFNPVVMEVCTRPALERIRKEFPFDIVFSIWGYPDAVAAMRIAKRFGTPMVTNLLGSDINDLASRPNLKPVILKALQYSNSVIVLSRAMAARTIDIGVCSSRIKVQYNGVDHRSFSVRDQMLCRQRLGLSTMDKVILYVGNLEKVKGPDILVDAFIRLSDLVDGKVTLAVIGAGTLGQSLQDSIHKAGLSHKVIWAGRRLHDEIPTWIGACSLVCVPSRMEGCPNIIIEALACGRPVVASAVGGIPELVSNDTGILTKSESPEELATALYDAMNCNTWNSGVISSAVTDLTWESFSQSVLMMLHEAIIEGPLNLSE